MKVSLQINNQTYQLESAEPLNIAIPLNFNGAQPNAYGVAPATSTPCRAGDLIGDTRRGGSCNFEEYRFIPHCNGTHTESVGHVTNERISLHDCLQDVFILATLVSVAPEKALDANETYPFAFAANDQIVTRRALQNALKISDSKFQIPNFDGLIVRTLPNDAGKLTRAYLDYIPPFFSTAAIEFMVENEIKHLLVDAPSIDRIFDDGKLSNHRAFWQIAPGAFETSAETRLDSTITEMIFVPDSIADGSYLLNLQIPAFGADAAPSRPVLFALSQ